MLTLLNQYGKLGVEMLQQAVESVSATHKTQRSIRYEASVQDEDFYQLAFFARGFFSAMETGRGPRRSTTPGGFNENLEDWMRARGIGSDLDEKKFKNLAKFLAYKINKEGDATHKKGGRVVYTPTVKKLLDEITCAVKQEFVASTITRIKHGFSTQPA